MKHHTPVYSCAKSKIAFERASAILVGGVSSPVRACRNVNDTPVFISRGEGSALWDIDQNKYIDYVLSYGPCILGHAFPSVVAELHNAIIKGTSFGACVIAETTLAELIQGFFPSCEKLRFVNSGTEALMSAVRLARGVTKRSLILKFHGCYHGHSDTVLVSAGSGVLTHGQADSEGIPDQILSATRVLQYNDIKAVEALFEQQGDQIAAVLVEPVAGNMGLVLPKPGFLEQLRAVCSQYGALLIFDEVMTGFRVDLGGAQGLYGIRPDITCLGKVIGGGLPCAAYGGSKEIMKWVSPEGPVYQAGTLSGNPLAMVAGAETLRVLRDTDSFQVAANRTQMLCDGLRAFINRQGYPCKVHHVGTMFCLFFATGDINSFEDVLKSDKQSFQIFYKQCMAGGIYIPPSPYETLFVSALHGEEDIQITLDTFESALRTVYKKK